MRTHMHVLITDPLFLDLDPVRAKAFLPGRISRNWEEDAYSQCDMTVLPYVPLLAVQKALMADDAASSSNTNKLSDEAANRQNEERAANEKRPTLLYFRGNTALARCRSFAGETPESDISQEEVPGYCSLRQKLVTAAMSSNATDDLDLTGVHANGAHTPSHYKIEDGSGLRSSTFCLAPRGDTGSSRRIYDAILGGCVPVIVADDVHLAFSTELDWPSFSLRVAESDAEHLVPYLRSIPASRVRQLRKGLRAVRDSFRFAVDEPFAPGPNHWEVGKPGGAHAGRLVLEAVARAATSPQCAARRARQRKREANAKQAVKMAEKATELKQLEEATEVKRLADLTPHERLAQAAVHAESELHFAAEGTRMAADRKKEELLFESGPPEGGVGKAMKSTDPDPLHLVGKRVRMKRLGTRYEYNGEVGTVLRYMQKCDESTTDGAPRYAVRLESTRLVVHVKPANLMAAPEGMRVPLEEVRS